MVIPNNNGYDLSFLDIFENKSPNSKLTYRVFMNNNIKNYPVITKQQMRVKMEYFYQQNLLDRDLYFRPNNMKYILLDLDNIPKTKWKKILRIFRGQSLSYGYYSNSASYKFKIQPFYIVNTSENNYQAWFWCPQIKSWDEYVAVAKWLAKEFGGDMGATGKGQLGRVPKSYNAKRGGHQQVIIIPCNNDSVFKFPKDYTGPLSSIRHNEYMKKSENWHKEYEERQLKYKEKGIHSHPHSHPHIHYHQNDEQLNIGDVLDTYDLSQSYNNSLNNSQRSSSTAFSRRNSQRGNASSNSKSKASSTMSPSGYESSQDFAFVSMVYERDPSKSRSDLINILSQNAKHSRSKSYVSKTVDAVMSQGVDGRSKSYSYNSYGLITNIRDYNIN